MYHLPQNDVLKRASNYIPRLYKNAFEAVAHGFLNKYFPEALYTSMPIPIEKIAREIMGLTIVERTITEDFSVFGMMCFTQGKTEIFDRRTQEFHDLPVTAGTMIIDPDTLFKRNAGCRNNTIAHECVHSELHREYHSFLERHGRQKFAFHCPTNPKDERFNHGWTDEDWMEWQANSLAPRILMPATTIRYVYRELSTQFDALKQSRYVDESERPAWIRSNIAAFYKVSRQSAGLRLEELKIFPKGTFPKFTVNKQMTTTTVTV
jgi:hypothetical protein